MIKTMKLSLLALALVLGSSVFAHANPRGGSFTPPKSQRNPNCNTAPEVDPGMAISGITLLGGALTVLRMKRRKQ
jgi:LPXTG-motif cell wall-anchored protein